MRPSTFLNIRHRLKRYFRENDDPPLCGIEPPRCTSYHITTMFCRLKSLNTLFSETLCIFSYFSELLFKKERHKRFTMIPFNLNNIVDYNVNFLA